MFTGSLPSNQHENANVYVRGRSALASLSAVTLRQKLQIKHATSFSRSMLTPGQPVLALIGRLQVCGKVQEYPC